ncbi:protein trichome birefringence-like 19 [Camellia sinensis]|uniref:protein trichome birefringence-like 19 n=1 Tax=Camellia sinensis TaxID=4442 RepID=UPI001035E29C|nr:protein trichome birefringence-like 19 [Camellia sinensis]
MGTTTQHSIPWPKILKPILIILIPTLVLVTFISLDYNLDNLPFLKLRDINVDESLTPPLRCRAVNDSISLRLGDKCDMSIGKWVPYPKGPAYYTNNSRCVIQDAQNCMKYGRPDTEFMKWRWKPEDCELPLFDAARFLEIVRGKSMAFVGDSLARNQMQSLGCMLSSVSTKINVLRIFIAKNFLLLNFFIPHSKTLITVRSLKKFVVSKRTFKIALIWKLLDVASFVEQSNTTDIKFRRWFYPDYNFTLQLSRTPFLVKARGVSPYPAKPIDLYLDEVHEVWPTQVEAFDYVIISIGHWFAKPVMYHEKGKVVGCSSCKEKNIKDLTMYYGYRVALETAFRTLINLRPFKGIVFLRTISPTHFAAEEMKGRGNCIRTRPFEKREMKYDWYISTFHMMQMDEFRVAKRKGRERGLKFRLLDVTEAMSMRPDGHPNHYWHPPVGNKRQFYDCLHWCLPGPIDTWNELLLQQLKTEENEGETY